MLRQLSHVAAVDLQVIGVDVVEQLERVQARAELLQRELAAELLPAVDELLRRTQQGHHLALGHLQHDAAALQRGSLQPLAQPRQQRVVLQRAGGELDEEGGLQALAFSCLQPGDGLVEYPAVDRAGKVVFFGDRHEEAGQHLALRPVHAQQDLGVVALGVLQADRLLVIQHQPVVGEGLLQQLQPVAVALVVGLFASGRVVQFHLAAAQALRGAQRLAGLVQQQLRVGVFLAQQAAADAGGDRDRARARVENLVADAVLQLGDPLLDGVVLARVQHHAEGVFGQHAGDILGAQQHADAIGEGGQQFIRLAQADAGHQRGPVVGLDQQQRLPLLALGRGGHRVVDALQHARPVEQPGHRIALQLFEHGRVDHLAAEDDLQAGLALERGGGEFHRGIEAAAVGAARAQGQLRGHFFLPRMPAQQRLEFVGVGGVDHVQHRQTEQVVEAVVAEGVEVGLVGALVHALMHIGDRVGGGIQQRVAAALRFAQRRLQPAQLAARLQRLELALQHQHQLLGLAAQGDAAHAMHVEVGHALVVHRADQAQQGIVTPGCLQHPHHFGQRQRADGRIEHHHIRLQLVHRGLQLLDVGGACGPHGDAGVAQQGDDLLRLLQRVLDEEDLDDVIFFHGAPSCP